MTIQKNATDLLNPNGGGFLRRLSSREDLESGPCENAPGYGRPWKWFVIFQIYLPDNLYLVTTDLVIVASVVVQPHFLVSDSVPIRVILRTVLKAILLTISHGHFQHIKNNWPVHTRKESSLRVVAKRPRGPLGSLILPPPWWWPPPALSWGAVWWG